MTRPSFSATQSFNTASSMARLTLNMLRSFAQFEREVTAERIRYKIAASKRKGLWLGGSVPLGYGQASASITTGRKAVGETRDRLTPSHANKNDKRLRYYISRRLVIDRIIKHPTRGACLHRTWSRQLPGL